VLQPDICVICDRAKLDERGCLGAPDIVIEILSAGNNKTELIHKYEVYEEFGVKEYWVINPTDKTLLKYNLSDQGKFISSGLFTSDEEATSAVLPGFVLHLSELFED